LTFVSAALKDLISPDKKKNNALVVERQVGTKMLDLDPDSDQDPYQMNTVPKHWKKLHCLAMKKSNLRIMIS
jgi:hypothetical protein